MKATRKSGNSEMGHKGKKEPRKKPERKRRNEEKADGKETKKGKKNMKKCAQILKSSSENMKKNPVFISTTLICSRAQVKKKIQLKDLWSLHCL